MISEDDARRHLLTVIENQLNADADDDDPDTLGRGIVTAYVVVAAVRTVHGHSYISLTSGNASSEELESWQITGLLHEGLTMRDWNPDPDED